MPGSSPGTSSVHSRAAHSPDARGLARRGLTGMSDITAVRSDSRDAPPLDERAPAALHEGPEHILSEDDNNFGGDDVDAMAAALLGELTAVCRTAIMLLVPSIVEPTRAHELVTGLHSCQGRARPTPFC